MPSCERRATPPVPLDDTCTCIRVLSLSSIWLCRFREPEASPPEAVMREMSLLDWLICLRMSLICETSEVVRWLASSRRLVRLTPRLDELFRKSLTAFSAPVRPRLDEGVSEAAEKAE